MQNRVVPLTDDRGRPLVPNEDLDEPHTGSVVLVNGLTGTAWQRHSDGLWHTTGTGTPKRWSWFLTERGVVLIYDAPIRNPRVVGVDRAGVPA